VEESGMTGLLGNTFIDESIGHDRIQQFMSTRA